MKKNSVKSKKAKNNKKILTSNKKTLVTGKQRLKQSKSKLKIHKTKISLKDKKATKDKQAKVIRKSTTQLSLSSTNKASNTYGPSNINPYKSKKNEPYMSHKQLEHFHKVLIGWKEELMAGVDQTVHHMQSEAANFPDPVDRATQEEEFSLELRARDRERKLLRKIDETLNRIDDHDYGYCDDCGAEIGLQRLEARPTATQCIECKTISEIREKQIGDGSSG